MKKNISILLVLFSAYMLAECQESKTILTFGMVTDAHYADIPDSGPKAYSQSLEKLKECVDTMNYYQVDFLIELGDFKDMSQPPSEEKALIFLYRIEKVFREFKGPVYHVLGNHDMDCITKEQFQSVTVNTGIPSGQSYYSFDVKGIHCIVLDANYDSLGKDFSKGQFDWGDPNFSEKELSWLKKDLRKAKGPTLVFCHQLMDGEGSYYVNNASKARKLMENSGKVVAVFQGHYHEGQYRMINDIHYYTLKALVDGGGKQGNSYAKVTLEPGTLKVQGFRNAESIHFGISNKKTGISR
ncbi:MAG: metallophosphoesterase [Bacteroidales bacterium]|nr:metallophosphoesterase [Bacteroidales bacterium]